MTRIYIASYFNTKERLLPYRDKLKEMGHRITSSWLEEPPNPQATLQSYTPKQLEGWARRDVEEILTNDLLILDTIDETNRGGREVEFGYALSLGLTIYRVGPVRNAFHYLADLSFDSWDELMEYMKEVE